jgi:hypothetical protein
MLFAKSKPPFRAAFLYSLFQEKCLAQDAFMQPVQIPRSQHQPMNGI